MLFTNRNTPKKPNVISASNNKVTTNTNSSTGSGGKLVYATCSVLPSENQLQIAEFLTSESGKDFILVKDNKVLAHLSGYDGFYMALLERKIKESIS